MVATWTNSVRDVDMATYHHSQMACTELQWSFQQEWYFVQHTTQLQINAFQPIEDTSTNQFFMSLLDSLDLATNECHLFAIPVKFADLASPNRSSTCTTNQHTLMEFCEYFMEKHFGGKHYSTRMTISFH